MLTTASIKPRRAFLPLLLSSSCRVSLHSSFLVLHGVFVRLACRALELCGSRGGRPGPPVANSLYAAYGRKATLSQNGSSATVFVRMTGL